MRERISKYDKSPNKKTTQGLKKGGWKEKKKNGQKCRGKAVIGRIEGRVGKKKGGREKLEP